MSITIDFNERIPVKFLNGAKTSEGHYVWTVELAGKTYQVRDAALDDSSCLLARSLGNRRFMIAALNGFQEVHL